MTSGDLLQEAVAELYSADPDEFIARRGELAARARTAGEAALAKQIESLRKPTRSAWVVNRLTRAEPDVAARLATLGAELRAAQQSLNGPALRELSRQRRQLVDALARQAFSVSGQKSPPAALREEVASTLGAALADPQVAEQLRAGALERAVHRDGLEAAAEPPTGAALPTTLRRGGAARATAPQDTAPQDTAPQDTAPQDTAERAAAARGGAVGGTGGGRGSGPTSGVARRGGVRGEAPRGGGARGDGPRGGVTRGGVSRGGVSRGAAAPAAVPEDAAPHAAKPGRAEPEEAPAPKVLSLPSARRRGSAGSGTVGEAENLAKVTALAAARAKAEQERYRQDLAAAEQAMAEAERAERAAAEVEQEQQDAVQSLEEQLADARQQLAEARIRAHRARTGQRRARRARRALDRLRKPPQA